MVPFEQVHRPSVLKQQNKKHNRLGHRTKGQVAALSKGRVNVVNISKAQRALLNREQRRNQAKQKQSHKRKEVINKKRLLGTESTPPFLVAIICVHDSIRPNEIIASLENFDGTISHSSDGHLHISCTCLKQRFSFILPPQNDVHAVLDSVKVCDTAAFVWKFGEALSQEKENLISSLKCQGIPSTVHITVGDDELSQKKRARIEKEMRFTVGSHFPENSKLFSLKTEQEHFLFFRQIGSQKRKDISFRDRRMHLLAEETNFIGMGTCGILEVKGYLRGKAVTANDLLHIPGWGDFQMAGIYLSPDPHPLQLNGRTEMGEMAAPMLVSSPDPHLQESLNSMRESFEEEEVEESEEDSYLMRRDEDEALLKPVKRIPKGVNDYMASWILSDEEDESEDGSDLEEHLAPKSVADNDSMFPYSDDDNDDEHTETVSVIDANDDYDENYDQDEEMEEFRKIKAATEDVTFPDEVDTPMDISARERFRKYRGLESFRTSPWAQNEKLPLEYSKIFQFKHFKHIKKMVLEEKKEGIEAGNYVVIHLENVPKHLYEEGKDSGAPLVLFSLLKNEQKMSVLNLVLISRSAEHIRAIRSKEKLIFHVGIRRFCNSPIFSEHTNGDKHKLLRFFHPKQTVMATMYAPITYPPCPVSVYQPRLDGSQVLVASGSVYSVDPKRIICKRIVLSGHPFKVHKKSAVVRYMFFNPLDVSWFKPVELRTKWGKKGHIMEPLGTHGHMKCKFNGQLKSQDTVLMKLYKRVFPKWNFDPHVETPSRTPKQRLTPKEETTPSLHQKSKKVRFDK